MMSGAKATCSFRGSALRWTAESAEADFHELRQEFIPPPNQAKGKYHDLLATPLPPRLGNT